MNIWFRVVAGAPALLALGCGELLGFNGKTFDGTSTAGGGGEGGMTTSNTGGGGAGGAGGSNTGGTGGLSTGGTTIGGSGGTGGGGFIDDLAPLTDGFDYVAANPAAISTQKGWLFAHIEESYTVPADLEVAAGSPDVSRLAIKTNQKFDWIDGKGFLMYRELEGDFRVETLMIADAPTNLGNGPTDDAIAAGLMARKPPSGNEDWISIDRGRHGFGGVALGVNTTINPDGIPSATPVSGTVKGHLAICRFGETIWFSRKDEGAPVWTHNAVLDNITSAPFAGDLQVGALVYVLPAAPSKGILAKFEYIKFARPQSAADCTPP